MTTPTVSRDTDAASIDDRRERATEPLEWISSPAVAWFALAVLLVGAGIFLFSKSAGTTFGGDDWIWAVTRRGNTPSTFLQSYNGHFSLIPIVIYRILFATSGLRTYVPYRLVSLAVHLGCASLVFVYARRRVGNFLALAAAALILFLGPGWENILWPFQMAWLISIAAGVGALILLDRRDVRGDGAACLLLACSLASSGVGPPIALGVAADVLGRPNRWHRAWIFAIPLALYGLWWLKYQTGAFFVARSIPLAAGFVASLASASLAGLVGLAGPVVKSPPGTLLTFGAPLAVLGVAAIVWRLHRIGRLSARVGALLVMILSFAILVAVERDVLPNTYSQSRYLYVGGVFAVLLAAELARGVELSRRAAVVTAVVVAVVVTSNVSVFNDAAAYLRSSSRSVRSDLGALAIGRTVVKPDYVATRFPGWPFEFFTAGELFGVERSLGSPVASVAEIQRDPDSVRADTDSELIGIHSVALQAASPGSALGARPAIDFALGGAVTSSGPCVTLRPGSFTAPGLDNELQVTVPPGGLRIANGTEPSTVAIRRFSTKFQAVGAVARSASTELRIGPDRSAVPWHARITASGGATVCGLS